MVTKYETSLRYKDTLNLLNNRDCTIKDIAIELDINSSTVHRYVKELLERKIIQAVGYRLIFDNFKCKARLYRIVKK